MGSLIPIIAILSVFGSPVAIVWVILAHRRRMAEIEASKQPRALPAASPETEERLRHLESIVCSVDFELNAKLNRLASRQMLAAPAGSGEKLAATMAESERIVTGQVTPGTRLSDRFVLEEAIGRGGMGVVYRARDEQLGETVAVKVIGGLAALDPAATERFRREVTAARRISHPNVVRIHDLGEHAGLLFLSMEFVTGSNLSDLIRRQGVLPFDQLRKVADQICAGLEAAHAAGVIHRDLKPANVLMDEKGEVKIIDFGVARLPQLEGMTATGMIMGTPEYMSPEQIRGDAVDARADVYAVGAILFHALTGHAPFRGDTPIAVGMAQLQHPVPPLKKHRADASEGWETLIQRALAKDPAERFPSVTALRAGLPPA